MSKTDESKRYKWSSAATNLLVSIWCHDLVQNQLKISSRNQPIWESIARYMSRKGFTVTGVQCRTRIKNMLCNYHEAIKKKDRTCIEPYYEIFNKVMKNKKQRKKDPRFIKFKQMAYSEKSFNENEVNLESDISEMEPSSIQNQSHSQNEVQNSESETFLTKEFLQELKKIIEKVIDSQTKAVINTIKMQSQEIIKLVVAESEKLESVMALEREGRRQLEMKFDRLLSRLEANSLPGLSHFTPLETIE